MTLPPGLAAHGTEKPVHASRSAFLRWARLQRMLIVLAGIVLGQAILYGPSLTGNKILLPLDLLYGAYIPDPGNEHANRMHDPTLSDLAFGAEVGRLFAFHEYRAGRIPFWNPDQYAGAGTTLPKFNPFGLLLYTVCSPAVLAWVQMLVAIVSGTGAFLFLRRGALRLGFWPAAVGAWVYPLTSWFVLWQGFFLPYTVCWLPWLLLAVDGTVRHPRGWQGVALASITSLVLLGQLDVAGQVLLTSGLYGVWRWVGFYSRRWISERGVGALALMATAWLLGVFLAAPSVLPCIDYSQSGSRIQQRSEGAEERPPIGLSVLPQIIFPSMYGSTERGSVEFFPPGQGNLLESTAAAYTGLMATLLLAPLGWCSRRHRSSNRFWFFLAFVGLSWSLNVPGMVQLLRMPGLNMMSHNRFVFASSFAILAMACTGLDTVARSAVQWRQGFWWVVALVAVLCYWNLCCCLMPPEPIATQLAEAIKAGNRVQRISTLADVESAKLWFAGAYGLAFCLCFLTLGGWALAGIGKLKGRWVVPVLGVLAAGDLLFFGYGRSAQCDPALYYPRLPLFDWLAKAKPGRILGLGNCLPCQLPGIVGLHDIRGYDGVDPARYLELMKSVRQPQQSGPDYAQIQYYAPRTAVIENGAIRLPPLLDMMGVRYVILRKFKGGGTDAPGAVYQDDGYEVFENRNALPRAFVPQRVETVENDEDRLQKLSSDAFNPRAVAYVEDPVELPGRCRGSAEMTEDTPARVVVRAQMETPGLLVLADRWEHNWHAKANGAPVEILQTNHAFRGVVLPAGTSTVEFYYDSPSFNLGLWLAGGSAAVLGTWGMVAVGWRLRRKRS